MRAWRGVRGLRRMIMIDGEWFNLRLRAVWVRGFVLLDSVIEIPLEIFPCSVGMENMVFGM